MTVVTNAEELLDALATADDIEVDGSLSGMAAVTLPPGTRLRGGTLRFGAKGIRLTSDNQLEDVTVIVPDNEVAIGCGAADIGRARLRNVRIRGQVLLTPRHGHVEVDGLTVASADLRGREERPHGFGVDVLQGAFTLWNRSDAPGLTATLVGISAGAVDAPIRGSGVFVAGPVEVDLLRTGPVYTDGGIEPGTPDLISGGVYVITAARVQTVINDGPVTTHGANDMALGSWGTVGSWTARAPVTTHGPSGIGYVSFGTLDRLDVQAPVTTHGVGARGFNVYDGHLASARFQRIATYGDGAVGVQVSKDLPVLEVVDDITTAGGAGQSLVRGAQVRLRAIAVSVEAGGRIGRLAVGGSLRTDGDDVVTLEAAGTVDELTAREIVARGVGSDAVRMGGSGSVGGLDSVTVTGPVHRAEKLLLGPGRLRSSRERLARDLQGRSRSWRGLRPPGTCWRTTSRPGTQWWLPRPATRSGAGALPMVSL
jgi:hypothetical protein